MSEGADLTEAPASATAGAAERWIGERRALWEERLDRLGEFLAEHSDTHETRTADERPPRKSKRRSK